MLVYLCLTRNTLFFRFYQVVLPDLYGRFIDDNFGAASIERDEMMRFINYVCNFNPAIQYSYDILEVTMNFLDSSIRIDGDRIATSIYTKLTDSHSYLQ